jgi:dipeptidyl aminopeptidase/acylaminoacyl peptidase
MTLPSFSYKSGRSSVASIVASSKLPERRVHSSSHSPLATSHSLFFLLCVLCVSAFSYSFFSSTPAHAQDIDKPLQSVDEEVTAFSYAPDGRLVYAVRRNFKTKKYDLEHDDIWLMETNGKKRRLLEGSKFTRSDQLFSYATDAFHWSPNGRYILAQLFTTAVSDDTGRTEDSFMTLVLDDNGKEIRLGKGESIIRDCYDASWLQDNSTIVYLSEVLKPRMLFSFRYSNIASGPAGPAFEGRTFIDSIRVPRSNLAIAVERDRNLSGPPRLQRLELLAQDDKEIATLDGYEGGLTLSPSGSKVAYFIDREVLEIRDLAAPERIARLRVGLGLVQWAPDETRILLKRAVERKSGDIVWITLPPLVAQRPGQPVPVLQPTPQPILHGIVFRDLAISPDGHALAVVAPGRRNLQVFPLPN